MSHFAQIDENNIVTQVIVADQDFIDSGAVGDPTKWIQTSYNTHAGQHPEGRPLRKNFAGIGYTYDPIRDAFIPPEIYPSWVLNEDTCLWESPVPYPDDGKRYTWDEEETKWIELVIEQ
jgi:hypothetical protein